MNNLIVMLDIWLKNATEHPEQAKRCYEQAFGAVQYHDFLFPNDYKQVEALWNDNYRLKFEKIIYRY